MNTPARTFAAALTGIVVLFGSVLMAQTAGPEAGLIGKRYAGADFGYDHFAGSTLDQAMGAAAVVNLPVLASVDLTVGYSYTDVTGTNFDAIDKAFSTSLLTHRRTEYGTGYFAATLGHAWNHVSALGSGAQDNGAFWGVRTGYEMPIAMRTALNVGLGYSDSFDHGNPRAQVLRCYAEVNHWFSRDLAGVLSASYRQVKDSPNAVSYTAGWRWAF